MPIVSGDIQRKLSGGAANSDPNASIGGVISSVSLTNATLSNLFDQVGSAEASAGDDEYRCFYFKNNHGSLTLQNAVIWLSQNTTATDTSVAIALAGEGVNGTAEIIANESTAPSGEAFTAPSSKALGCLWVISPPVNTLLCGFDARLIQALQLTTWIISLLISKAIRRRNG